MHAWPYTRHHTEAQGTKDFDMLFPSQDTTMPTTMSQQLWTPEPILPKNEPTDSQSGLDGGAQDTVRTTHGWTICF